MLIIPLNLDTVLLLLHNSKLAYWSKSPPGGKLRLSNVLRTIKIPTLGTDLMIKFPRLARPSTAPPPPPSSPSSGLTLIGTLISHKSQYIRIFSIGLELLQLGMEANAGTSVQMQILFNIFPRISLHCKLVPVPY